MMEICGISGYEKRFPKQLSEASANGLPSPGFGDRTQVALARRTTFQPRCSTEGANALDDQANPTGTGDHDGIVTHDQEECFSISDRVAIMDKGRIEQCDTPQ